MSSIKNPSEVLVKSGLFLSNLGIEVSPGFGITDGICGCRNRNCHRAGKHPFSQEDQNFGTLNNDEIRSWFEGNRSNNLLVQTGLRSKGLIILDCDINRNGGRSHVDLLMEFPQIKTTLTIKTGSNGFHYYLKTTEPMPTLSNLIGHGLDIIGEGGYAVAPGSTHISGNKYVFVNKNPIIQLPTKLKEKILDAEKQFLRMDHFKHMRRAAIFLQNFNTKKYKNLREKTDFPFHRNVS